jgi:DNA-binding LytR/AlgR family response regulator
MKILIVEDEKLAAERLAKMVLRIEPRATIVHTADSVGGTLEWLQGQARPDLGFFDIQLADGLSFSIFEQTEIRFPVIFTTAYDEYALKAFKVNSIDYLLKPIAEEELAAALKKYHQLNPNDGPSLSGNAAANAMLMMTRQYKSRFLLKTGEHLVSVPTLQIAVFYSFAKGTFLVTLDGKAFDTDHTLDELEHLLDPVHFFRVSRQFIIRNDAIRNILQYSGSRLKVSLQVKTPDEIIVSREKVTAFKHFLGQ